MKLGGWAGRLALLCSVLVWTSCGDVYRSPIIPLPSNAGDPKLYHFVMTISQNTAPVGGALNPGSIMQIDTSGDTNIGVANLGTVPVHAAILPNFVFNRVFIANAVSDTVSTLTAAPQSCGSTTGVCPMGTVASITLPQGSHPSYLHSSEGSQMYVTLPGLNPPAIGVINANTNQFVATIPLPGEMNPSAMAELFVNPRKLYVANQGSNTVSVIDTLGRNVTGTITVGPAPTMVIAHPDGSAVYVLNAGNNQVSVISTSTDSVIGNLTVGGTANSIAFDSKLTRLYVTDSAGGVNIFDASTGPLSLPVSLRTVSVPNVIGVAPLPDGSKVYALSVANGATIDYGLTPIDSLTLAAGSTLPVASVTPNAALCGAVRFRHMVGASGDSQRAYVMSCDGQATYILRTTNNTLLAPLPAPSTGQIVSNNQQVLQNPVFLVEGH